MGRYADALPDDDQILWGKFAKPTSGTHISRDEHHDYISVRNESVDTSVSHSWFALTKGCHKVFRNIASRANSVV